MEPRREPSLRSFGPQDVPVVPYPAEGPQPLSVTDVVQGVNRRLAADPSIWVRGELSGFKAHSSGHWYFSLKDANETLNAAMFRGANGRVRFTPQDGMEVLARGRLNVYGSKLQLVVEQLNAVSAKGDLALAFEQLRARLAAEGLFDLSRKRPIPQHPAIIGVVTSMEGAVLRDMVRIATARNPAIRLVVVPTRMQGQGSAAGVVRALERLNAQGVADVIVVGRGGGSADDLWSFNEEALVRAVAASRIPVVSAIGHETDVTLCDHAADLRAATPSNAMELIVPDAEALHERIDDAEARMAAALDSLVPALTQRVDELHARAADAMRRTLAKERELLHVQAARLDALSPLATLARGFAVARRDGKVVRSVDAAPAGADIEVILPDGRLDATVKSTRKEARHGQG